MDGIRSWIEAEGSGHWLFAAFPVILLCLFIWFKGRRVRFLIPSLIISIVIINPWFYRAWDELGLYAYWRILWIIPVIPVAAGLVPSISEKFKKTWVKSIVAAVGVGAVVFGGTFIYNGAGGSFTVAANASKEPDYVVQIADRLLELDEHPRVVAQYPIGVYLRQYTGEVDSLFGRDNAANHIGFPSADAMMAHRVLSDPAADKSIIAQFMLDDDYDYLVYSGNAGESFERVDVVGDYGIYKAVGKPTVVKDRNELGQVISITVVDDNGKPVNNENGHSTVAYTYDDNGYVSRLFRSDKDGNGIDGEERKLDASGRVVDDYKLDANGKRCEQQAGFYGYTQRYDQAGKLLSRTYIDSEGNTLNRSDGFSKVVWEAQDTITSVKLYDKDGNKADIKGVNLMPDQDGSWSDWMTPKPVVENCCFVIGAVNLGEKAEGDAYSCQIEIEFKDVVASEDQIFRFRTQGTADNSWYIGNVWNDLISLDEPVADGIYSFESSAQINEKMAAASFFEIGFRCDNWSSGSFRVRKVKIEKNNMCSEWSQGL